MISVQQLLVEHAEKYPKMQPCDAVKLLYQRVFGGGHLVTSESASLDYIRQEYAGIDHSICPKTEILGQTARIYLNGIHSEERLRLLSQVFCASSHQFCKDWESADDTVKRTWEGTLEDLRKTAELNLLPFDLHALEEYLKLYKASAYPPVRHSEIYRENYHPAYRVIDSRYVRLLDVLQEIEKLRRLHKKLVIAIDGRCASGKTTAAQLISQIYPAETIHMDDFFLPGEMRTPERMEEVGGNLHRERFIEEVLPNLRAGSFSHRVFQCSTFTYAQKPRHIQNVPVIICEGSYALHPSFGKYYDLAIFSDADEEEQLDRIRKRDGEFMLSRFRKEWIPMEERYFTEYRIREKCDFIL